MKLSKVLPLLALCAAAVWCRPAAAAEPPRLTVIVVVDQLSANNFERRLPRARFGFRLATVRPPTDAEQQSKLAFLSDVDKSWVTANVDENQPKQNAWEILCHVILAANEFIYVR